MKIVNHTRFQNFVTGLSAGAAVVLVALATLGLTALPARSDAQSRVLPLNLAGPFGRVALGAEAFALPRIGLTPAEVERFFEGQRLFNLAWVAAPSFTKDSDGLGPVFNRVGCGRCHEANGRGAAPAGPADSLTSAVLRLGIPGPNGVRPDPVYGRQLQSRANPGIRPEGYGMVRWRTVQDRYGDGTPYTLRAPVLAVRAPQFGALHPGTRLSLRLAPPVFGMGALAAIPDKTLAALADPIDRNRDGISGRLAVLRTSGAHQIGRFGWKAAQPTLAHQTGSAFSQDMGLTSTLFPSRVCARTAADCRSAAQGGTPEVTDGQLQTVAFYLTHLAVPTRRAAPGPAARRGEALFRSIGCAACHLPRVTIQTKAGPVTIHPMTDLLLHDMGPGLSDGLPEGAATAREWRTPPLWGLSRTAAVNGNRFFLHDGRARTLAEAILWHGGEAKGARERFRGLGKAERAALIAFLESL